MLVFPLRILHMFGGSQYRGESDLGPCTTSQLEKNAVAQCRQPLRLQTNFAATHVF